jgi:hypothetical protein
LTEAQRRRSLLAMNNDAAATMTRPLHGRRIALLETREADRLAAMLREDAEIVSCPAVAIVLTADPAPALAWLGRFIAAPFDDLILLTGEGLHRLRDLARPAGIEAAFLVALGRTRTICRARSRSGRCGCWGSSRNCARKSQRRTGSSRYCRASICEIVGSAYSYISTPATGCSHFLQALAPFPTR